MNTFASTTTKWAAAGAAFGASVAVAAGLAFASGPAPSAASAQPGPRTSGPQSPANSSMPSNSSMTPMMSAMLHGLPPRQRAQFEVMYAQMLAAMASTDMMGGSDGTGMMTHP